MDERRGSAEERRIEVIDGRQNGNDPNNEFQGVQTYLYLEWGWSAEADQFNLDQILLGGVAVLLVISGSPWMDFQPTEISHLFGRKALHHGQRLPQEVEVFHQAFGDAIADLLG